MSPFQTWLSENESHLPDLSINLFKDSLKCFYNEIERPAYLLAYQGVMVYVREVLMRSDPPIGFTEPEWRVLLKTTQKDDAWDTAVFDLIKRGSKNDNSGNMIKAAPLNIPDSLRSQFEFWRIQRNVCAHYKKDPFLRAHVEAFYGFISHWLLKISGVGGTATMISKITDFCDPSKTPSNADINKLIEDIPQYVVHEEYSDFLKDAVKVFSRSYRRDASEFMSAILGKNNGSFASIRGEMLNILKGNDRLLEILLETNVTYVIDLFSTEQEIREFWYEGIHNLRRNRLNVFAVMLEAGKIPIDQKKEAIHRMLEKLMAEDRNLYDCTEDSVDTLNRHGYFDEFAEKYITPDEMNSGSSSKLSKWCYQSNFFIGHLSHAEMTKNIIDRLLICFGSGQNVPFTIRDRLKSELWDRNDYQFKDRFQKTAKENSLNILEAWIK